VSRGEKKEEKYKRISHLMVVVRDEHGKSTTSAQNIGF